MRDDTAREDLALNGSQAKQAEHEKRSTQVIRENDNANAVAVTADEAVHIFQNNIVLHTVKVAQTGAALPPPAGNGPVKVLKPDAAGVVVLPAGSKISVIQASGGDLRIVLDDGSVFVVEGGVANPPSIQIGNETIPGTSLTAVFGPFQEVQPAAGDTPPGSSPNFTTTSTSIDQGFQFSELLGAGPTNLFGRGGNDDQNGNEFTPLNDAPSVGTQQAVSVDEDAVDGVTTNPSAANVFNGQLVYVFGSNGPNAIAPVIFDAQPLTDLGLTAGGAPVVFAWDASNFTLTGTANGVAVFSLRMVDPVAGTYVITLSGAFDHAGSGKDGIALSIPFLIRDSDGTEKPGVLNVTVVDDVPAANAVAGTADENAQIVIDLFENVAGDFYAGADGLLSIATGAAMVSNTHGLTLAIPALTFDPALYRLTVVLGPTYDALSAGETATVTVPYTVTDGDGDSVANSIVLTITGTNDTPTITAAVGAVEEFEDQTLSLLANTVFGVIDFTDLDVNDVGHTAAVVSVAASDVADGLPAGSGSPVLSWLQLGAVTKTAGSTNGTIAWTFSAQDQFFDYLAAGQILTLTYTIALDDGDGGVTNQTVTVTVVGTNDRPQFIAGAVAGITELTNSLESPTLHLRDGTLTFSDVDRDNIGHTAQVSFVGATGVTDGLDQTAIENALSITAPVKALDAQSGTIAWSFSAADREFDYLARGEQLVLTYNVTVDDGAGGTDTTTITVTVTGTNDVPVLTAGTGEIEERTGTTLSVQANSTFGTLAFDDYDLNDVGHTARVTGVSRSGESDGLPSGLIGNALVRSWLQIGDVTKAAGSTGGTIDWTFSAADAFFDYLAEGEEVQLTYTVELNDRDGGITTTTVTITVTGTNDRPVFIGGGLAFDSEIFNRTDIGQRHDLSGTLNFVDVDRDNIGHTADVEYIGAIGTTSGLREQRIENALTVDTPVKLANSQIGSIDWSFSARDRLFDYLAAGEFVTLAYRVSVDDGAGGTDSTVVLVTILGTNDRPIIQPGQDQARLREIAGQTGQYDLLTAQKTLTFTDADLSDTHSVQARLTDLDWSDGARRDIPDDTRDALRNDAFEVTLIDGPGGGEIVWSFSIEDRLVDFLGKDETLTIEYTVRVRDDSGESNSDDRQTVTITITGRNDRPVIEASSNLRGRVFEPGDVFGVQEAGYGAGLEITIPICGCIQMQLDSITSNPANIQNVLSAVNSLVGNNPALALAIVWNYLDDAYTAAPSQEINEAFVYLGIAYAAYLEAGLMPLTDVVAKYDQDTNGNDIPQRSQSLHDNLLGNLNGAVLASRFGAGSALYNQFMALIGFLQADPTTRPYFAGNEGNDVAAVRQWDIDNGYIPSASGQVIASDADQNAVLTFSAPSAGTYGTFSIDSATGRWTYHLDSDRAETQALAEGERVRERFQVTVTDEHGASATRTVVIVVIGTNDAPVVSVLSDDDAVASLTEADGGLTVSGTLTVSDVDANAVLSAEKLTVTANGPVGGLSADDLFAFFSVTQDALADGDKLTWSFDSVSEAFNFLKAGETLTLTYSVRVSDGEGAFDDINVTVTITGTNDAPTAEAVTAQGNEDALIEVVFSGGDVDGTFDFVIKSLPSEGTLYRNANGTGELQVGDVVSGPVYFAPSANFSGQESFNYASVDDSGAESPQTTATVSALPVADAPLFDAPLGAASGDEDTAITVSGAVVSVADTDGSETIKLVLSGFPAGTVFSAGALDQTPGSDTFGKWVIADGVASVDLSTVTFTTPENWNGQFMLTVEAIVTDSVDIGGTIYSDTRTETRTIDVTVNPVNDVPTAVALTLSVNEDEVLAVALAGSDVEGDVEFVITSLPANGGLYRDSAATDAIGAGDRVSGPVYFKPDANWNGDTSFDYTAIDEDSAQSAPVTVSIEVIPVNDAPTAENVTVAGNEDALITVTLDGADSDGTVSGYVIKSLPSNGTLYRNADGTGALSIGDTVTGDSVYFRPATNFSGQVTFDYTAIDNAGEESAEATATVNVAPVADVPTLEIFTEPSPRGAEVRLNTTISGEQVLPTVAALGNGYVSVWMNQSGQIYFQLMAADQTKVGTEQVVATGTSLVFPAVTVLDSGGFVVVWEGSGASGAGVYARAYDSAGTGGTAFFVGAGASASIDALPNSGGFAVAYTNGNNLYVSRYTESGTFASTKTITLSSAVGFAEIVALNAAGSVAVIYQSGAGIVYTVLDGSDNTTGSGTVVSGGANASISASATGGFIVSWVGGGAQGNGVYAKLYDSSGTAISGNLFVGATNLGEYSSVVALPDGGYVVSYSVSSDVYAQRLTSGGLRVGNPFLLSVSDAGNQVIDPHYGGTPTMTVLSNGDLVVTWTYAGPGSSGFDVYSRVFALDVPAIVTGAEDSTITLPLIRATVTDLDGSETLVIALSDFPAGTTFSVGAYDSASGKWLITDPTQIANLDTMPLTMTPPANYNGSFTITVEAIVTDTNGVQTDTYTETSVISVTVNPVNDAPTAEAVSAQGNEDTLIAVAFDGADIDGTVTGYVIKSLPSGGTLYRDAAGTIALAIGDTVTSQAFFKPDANFSGQVTFSYAAIDNNFEESAAATATVNMLPIADAPIIAGGQIEVISPLTGTDNSPLDTTRLIALSNGNFAMILRGSGTGGYSDIFAKIIDGDGNTVVSRFALTSTNGVNETQPQIAALPNGGFVATWQTLASPVPTDVFVRIYDPVTGLSSGIVVNDAGTTRNRDPEVTTFSDGGFVVVWHSETDGDIHARIFNASGNALTGEFVVNDPNSTPDTSPQVTTLSGGGFVVTWQAVRGDEDVFARVYDADGTPRSGEFSVNVPNSTGDNEWQVTALRDGGFVVTWLSAPDLTGMSVYAQVFDASGTALKASDILVSAPNNFSEDDVQVTALSSGGFVITYTSQRDDDGTWDNNIYGRVFDADGNPVSNEITISPANNANDTISQVVGLADGGFAVLWKSLGGSRPEVFARQFDADGNAVGGVVTLGTAWLGGSNPNAVTFNEFQVAIDPESGRLVVAGTVTDIPFRDTMLGVFDTRAITVSGNEDTQIALPAVTVNTSDTDGSETLTVAFSGFPAGTVFSQGALDTASGKWVIVSGVQNFDLSSIEMTPIADYAGNFKLTLEVIVTDSIDIGGVNYTSTRTESREIDVTVTQVNDIPTAESLSVSGDENTILTVNLAGNDIEGPVTFIVKSLPANGALYLAADGSGSPITVGQEVSGPVYFKPNALWSGSTAFTYVAFDSDNAESAVATVSIVVNDVNNAPAAENVAASGDEDTLIAVTFDGEDSDGTVDGYVIKGLPANGTLYRNADGTGAVAAGDTITGDTVYFRPAANFSGQVTFGYAALDNAGAESAEATATVDIAPVADVPVLTASATASGDEDLPVELPPITAAVTDLDGSESLVIALSGYPSGATFSAGAYDSVSGKWLITDATEIADLGTSPLAMTPPSNWNGSFTLTVEATVIDTSGVQTDTYTETRTIAVTVDPVNDVPAAQAFSFNVSEDATLNGAVAGSDVDNDPLTFALVAPLDGLTFNADGTFAYTPPATYQSLNDGQSATVTFDYRAFDGIAYSAAQTVTITINGADDAPPVSLQPAEASPIYAFAKNPPPGQPDTISLSLANLFVGQGANMSYTFEPLMAGNGSTGGTLASSPWSWLQLSNNVLTGNPPDQGYDGLYTAKVIATNDLTGETSFAYVAFSVIPDGATYISISTNNQPINGAVWMGAVYELGEGVTSPLNVDGAIDVLIGNSGNNQLSSGWANDALYGRGGDDILRGGSQSDFLSGGAGNDTLYGDSENDILLGDSGNDTLYGDSGNDLLYGGSGDDILYDGAGADQLFGGDGNDILYASADGNQPNQLDRLTGGAGDDRFVMLGNDGDIILDYGNGDDVIDLSALFTVPIGQNASGYVDLVNNQLWFNTNGNGTGWQLAATFSGSIPTSVSILYDDTAGAIHRQTIT